MNKKSPLGEKSVTTLALDKPLTEVIGLEIIATAKNSTNFHGNPRNYGGPQNFHRFSWKKTGVP